LNRRHFLSGLAAGGALGVLRPQELIARVAADGGLVIGHLAPAGGRMGSAGAAAARGAQLGAAEAAQAAARRGVQLRLLEASATGEAESVAAAARLTERGATVILGGFGSESALALSSFAADQGVIFLNVASAADELREQCTPTTFHVIASTAMLRDAFEIWVGEGGDRDSGAAAVEWSSELEPHGARQLNDRYRLRFNEPMSSASWTSWMAIRLAWEAHARTSGGDAREMADFLAGDGARFDGHKGLPLSFRPWNHQLRQPLYIARHGEGGDLRIEAEVPRIPDRVADPEALLDTLGGAVAGEGCLPRG
jgi:ABC-type branched-subunit amino acid transport system substrate-binding protein